MKLNDIVVIDDDADDCELFNSAFTELGVSNAIIVFNDPVKAFSYLSVLNKNPFFIICDVNMHQISGLELREKINESASLPIKTAPFLFCSTSESEEIINKAYTLNIQGYFQKPNTFEKLKAILKTIIDYWSYSNHPLNL